MINRGERDTGVCRFAPVEVIERRSTGGHPVAEPRMRRAQAFIKDNLTRLKRVEEVPAGVGLSRRSLDRLFIEHVEVSPADWIAQRRAERAETLLRETDYTVEHVAELVGFEDRRRLYRAFKKLNRPSPRKFGGGSEGAAACGFNKQGALSENFLRRHGCTPGDYRTRNRELEPTGDA